MKYSFNGSHLNIILSSGREFNSFMGGYLGKNYAAYFGYLLCEVVHKIQDRITAPKYDGLSYDDLDELRDIIGTRIKLDKYIEG